MSDAKVTYELVGNVALVGLDRAGKRNALNDEMVKLLREAVFRGGEEARAGVIHAYGDNFSAGLDLAEALIWMDPEAKEKRRMRRGRWHRPFDLIAR
ncbi:MAG: crotonase/enoyl-CoA hydratase family protein, partial [Rhizomicrobium sp.]